LALTAAVLGFELVVIGAVNVFMNAYSALWRMAPVCFQKYRRAFDESGKPTLLILVLLVQVSQYVHRKWKEETRFAGIGYKVSEKY
jgi:hypothetical protein